eukprot:COSAG04_NODE_81_length_27945_cov_46.142821_25_plen_161_part_00
MHNQADASDFAAGAIFVTDNATATAVGGSFDSNAAASQFAAGAIYARQATIMLSNLAFTENEALGALAAGGVLYADESAVSITRTNSSDNLATGGTRVTASNYADALNALQSVSFHVRDSSFSPMLGVRTVAVMPPAQTTFSRSPSSSNWNGGAQPSPRG